MFGVESIRIEPEEEQVHASPYFPKGHVVACVLGVTGCGKSFVMMQLVAGFGDITQVIICSKVAFERNAKYQGVAAYCEQHDIDFQFFNDPITASQGIQALCDAKPPEEWGLIIFDDFSDQKSSRSDPFNLAQNNVSAMMRNYSYHSIYVTQAPTNIPTLVRNNVSMRILFKVNNTSNLRSIRDDFLSCGACENPEEFNQLYDMIRDVNHAYIMAVTKGSDKRTYIYQPNGDDPCGPNAAVPALVVREDHALDSNMDEAREMIANDPYLRKLKSHLEDQKGSSSITFEFRARIKRAIRKHSDYVAERLGVQKNDLMRLISDYLKIDLS